MKKLFGLLVSGLLTVGCGEVKIKVDDVNGLNPKDAKFAIFNLTTAPADIDLDGINDFDVTALTLIASDQEDLCAALAADPDAIANLPDVQAVQIAAIRIDALGQGKDFEEGEIKGNKSVFEVLLAGAPGDTALLSAISIRVGGVDKVTAFDDGFFEASDGVLDIKNLTAGAEISADFVGTLTQEVADSAFFDTDQDGDGINDFQTLNNELEVSFKNVQFCAL
jgi:hypothetical protein